MSMEICNLPVTLHITHNLPGPFLPEAIKCCPFVKTLPTKFSLCCNFTLCTLHNAALSSLWHVHLEADLPHQRWAPYRKQQYIIHFQKNLHSIAHFGIKYTNVCWIEPQWIHIKHWQPCNDEQRCTRSKVLRALSGHCSSKKPCKPAL